MGKREQFHFGLLEHQRLICHYKNLKKRKQWRVNPTNHTCHTDYRRSKYENKVVCSTVYLVRLPADASRIPLEAKAIELVSSFLVTRHECKFIFSDSLSVLHSVSLYTEHHRAAPQSQLHRVLMFWYRYLRKRTCGHLSKIIVKT